MNEEINEHTRLNTDTNHKSDHIGNCMIIITLRKISH